MVNERYENITAGGKSILQKSQSQNEENRIGISRAIIFHIVICKESRLSHYSGIIGLGLHLHFLELQTRPSYLFILDESNAWP